METYRQIKARHQAEVDAFPKGAAFNERQRTEMMGKLGLSDDRSGYAQLTSLGHGCYIRRSDRGAWIEMAERHARELREFRRRRDELRDAFVHEFEKHECQYHRDDEAVCAGLGLTVEELQADPELRKTYTEAWERFMRAIA